MSDRRLAERLVAAGVAAARRAGPARTAAKSADPADVVGAADHAAEAAMLALIPPGDAVLTEESGAVGAAAPRTWVLDPVDGTANLQAGRGGLWCVAAALTEGDTTVAAAVAAGEGPRVWSAGAGHGATATVSGCTELSEATVACFLPRQLGDPSVVGSIAGAVGALHAHGCGSLELAWVAEGRLDAWLQPRPAPWDWLPGARLVEAGGGTTHVTDDGWHLAGPAALVRALAEEAPWRR